jgi:hypothetical protein
LGSFVGVVTVSALNVRLEPVVATDDVICAVSTVHALVCSGITETTVHQIVVTPEVLVQGVFSVLEVSEEILVAPVVRFCAEAVCTPVV